MENINSKNPLPHKSREQGDYVRISPLQNQFKPKGSAALYAGRLSQGPKPKSQIARNNVQEEQKRNFQLNGDTILNEYKPATQTRFGDPNLAKYMKPSSYSVVDTDKQVLINENERLRKELLEMKLKSEKYKGENIRLRSDLALIRSRLLKQRADQNNRKKQENRKEEDEIGSLVNRLGALEMHTNPFGSDNQGLDLHEMQSIQLALRLQEEENKKYAHKRVAMHHPQDLYELGMLMMGGGEEQFWEEAMGQNGEPNPDNMTYEELLELEEKMGKVSRGFTKHQIDSIPIERFVQTSPSSQKTCPVCHDDFQNNEKVKKLNCNHSYHTNCIDPWLSKEKRCPLCMTDIVISDLATLMFRPTPSKKLPTFVNNLW